LLLSGPLGLGLAESGAVRKASEDISIVIAIGDTPGLSDDYKKNITDILLAQGLDTMSETSVTASADVFLCVGWRKLIDVDDPDKRVFVVHDSLLPALRGWNPLVTAVELGLETTGITVFLAEKGPDTGPIFAQQSFLLGDGVSIGTAIQRAGSLLPELFMKFIGSLVTNQMELQEQEQASATLSPWRGPGDYLINWAQSSKQVQQFVLSRGWPYAGAESFVDGKPVRVWRASAHYGLPPMAIESSGKIVAFIGSNPVVACGSGFLRLQNIQTPDGGPFQVRSFRTRFGKY
jgi:methionyl-tRNA formyltransferase